MAKTIKVDPERWLEAAFYDRVAQWNRGELRVGDLLSPTQGELDERAESDGEYKPDVGWHHPSNQTSRCLRRKQFALIGMPKTNPVEPQVSVMGIIGTAIHRTAAKLLTGHPRVMGAELPIADPTVPIRGRMDMKVIDHDDVPAIVDWKGCMTLPTAPKDEHVEQVLWYQYMDGVPRGIIEYVNRGNAAMRRFTLNWRDYARVWEQSRDEAVKVTDITVAAQLAPRTPGAVTECRTRCQFKDICDATEVGDQTWLPLAAAAVDIIQEIDHGIS